MHFLEDRSTARIQGKWLVVILATITVLMLVATGSAQAAASVGSAWGVNSRGQLGDGTTEGPEKCGETACSTAPVAISGLSDIKQLSGGAEHALAVLEDGTVRSWGSGFNGELGDGTLSSSDVPVGVCEAGYSGETPCTPEHYLKGVVAVAAPTNGFSVALLEDGTVVDWGQIPFADLGDGHTVKSNVPVHVCEVGYSGEAPCTSEHYLKEVKAITANDRFALAIVGSSGGVAAWGENDLNKGSVFGDGTESPGSARNVPVAVCAVGEKAPCAKSLSGVSAVAAGSGNHALALSAGKLVSWGDNRTGELGNGNTESTDSPVEVKGLNGAITGIAAGKGFSLAVIGGHVQAWGVNEHGQLGVGSNLGPELCGELKQPCSTTPVSVSGLSGVTTVAAGGEHSLALLSSGSVLAWGANGSGQLGDGTSTGPEPCGPAACSTKPVAVSTHGAVAGIAAGERFSLAFGPPPPTASNLPELGRCVKVTTKKGAYSHAGCTILNASHRGAFEWMPGPGEKKKFEGVSVEGVKLETVGKQTISCGGATFEGEYTGPKTASVTFNLIGCENGSKQSCQSAPVIEGEIQSPTPEEAELGFITGGEKPTVGLDLKPKAPSTNLWTFECGKPPEKTVAGAIEGSVIAPIKRIDVMSEEFTLAYRAKGGKQIPERFEGGLKDTLLITSTAGVGKGEKSEEQAGLIVTLTMPNEEPLEIKAKP